MNEEKRYSQIELKIVDKVLKSDRICYFPGCSENATKSHILQENGVLNFIADKKKLFMEQSQPTPFRPLDFYAASINTSKMLTFKGFCNTHDCELFKEIENGQIDFHKHKHQLLFSYRGLLNDLYGAQVTKDVCNKALHDNRLVNNKLFINKKQIYEYERNRKQVKINDLLYYKMMFEKEINLERFVSNFKFYTFRLPKIDIATSTIYGGATILWVNSYLDLDYKKLIKIDPTANYFSPVSHPVFVNLIPQENSLLLILGHVNTVQEIESIPISMLANLDTSEILNLLGYILPKINCWGVSKQLYTIWKEEGKIEKLFDVRNNWLAKGLQRFSSSEHLHILESQNKPFINFFNN